MTSGTTFTESDKTYELLVESINWIVKNARLS